MDGKHLSKCSFLQCLSRDGFWWTVYEGCQRHWQHTLYGQHGEFWADLLLRHDGSSQYGSREPLFQSDYRCHSEPLRRRQDRLHHEARTSTQGFAKQPVRLLLCALALRYLQLSPTPCHLSDAIQIPDIHRNRYVRRIAVVQNVLQPYLIRNRPNYLSKACLLEIFHFPNLQH